MHFMLLFADAIDILKFINSGGVLGLLVIAIVGGYRKWWVYGWIYREVERERDDWRDIALHGTDLAEKTVDLFKRSRNQRKNDD